MDKRTNPPSDGDNRNNPPSDGDKRKNPASDGDKRNNPQSDGDKRKNPQSDWDEIRHYLYMLTNTSINNVWDQYQDRASSHFLLHRWGLYIPALSHTDICYSAITDMIIPYP